MTHPDMFDFLEQLGEDLKTASYELSNEDIAKVEVEKKKQERCLGSCP